jgi:hypothetical protein
LKPFAAVVLLAAVLIGCGGDDSADDSTSAVRVADIGPAIEAVQAELGAGQQFFEVNATAQLVNLFVAVDDATSAVPYIFFDGELQPPAPALAVESGFTFSADAVAFDADTVLADVADELPDSSIEGFAIEGGDGGIVRYLVSTRSPQGGVLAVTVAPDGAILEVDPL